MTTSTGQSVSAAGYAGGSVTQTGETTSWTTQAAGGARNNTTGATGAAAHTGSGQVTQSGTTTSYSRSGQTSAAFPDGTTASMSRSGSGAYDSGTGTGSYSGSSAVTTRSGGTVSTETDLSYARGEGVSGSTTVTRPDGSTTTRTYGDVQQAQGIAPAAQRSAAGAAPAPPWQAPAPGGRYSPQDLAAATRSHQSAWGQLGQAMNRRATPAAPHGRGGRRR